MRCFALVLLISCALIIEDRLRTLHAATLMPDVAIPFVVLFGLHCERATRLPLVVVLAVLRVLLTREPIGRDLLLMLIATEGLARARVMLFVRSFANLLVLSSLTALWFVCGRTLFLGVVDGREVDMIQSLSAAASAALVAPLFVRLVVWSRTLNPLIENWS